MKSRVINAVISVVIPIIMTVGAVKIDERKNML